MKLKISVYWFVFAGAALAADLNQSALLPLADNGQVQRGKYLVERVALCGECHTPRDDNGHFDRTQWLQGNVLDYKPISPMRFAPYAPPIAGLPGYTNDAAAVKFFETGLNASGREAMPPMPQFRLDHDDAVAVVAYLRSLKPTATPK